MIERRRSRRTALELLYQVEVVGASVNKIIENHQENNKEYPLSEFSLKLVTGIYKHIEEIDQTIESYTDNWSIERMPILDRNIIRMCLYEMLYEDDIPFSVSINEAVELAKTYSTAESSKFVNGVLGKIAIDLKSDKK
ncbi:MAG: transcription antitermination factor NusB [Actinobacteria bacterium]|nr:transcription antitermination factor NusB [Actinomycetota bacterium]